MINLSKIGGTDVSALIGKNKYKRPIDIYRRIIDGVVDDSESRAAKRGKILETPIINWWAEESGEQLIAPPVGENERFRWTPDGATKSGKLVEIKTASPRMWREWADGPPAHYITQVQWYLEWTGIEVAALVAFMGDDIQEYVIERDLDEGERLVNAGEEFWEKHLLPRIPPPADGSPEFTDFLKAQKRQEILIPANEELERLKAEWDMASAALAACESEAELAKQKLIMALGDAEAVDGNGWRCTYREQSRKTTAWKEVAAEAKVKSDLIEKFTKTSTTRVFRVTNGAK